jgi:hypothetical protein
MPSRRISPPPSRRSPTARRASRSSGCSCARRSRAAENDLEKGPAVAPLAAIEQLAAGKLGLERIELGVRVRARRQEELRQRLLADLGALADAKAGARAGELTVAWDLLSLAGRLDAGNERLELLRRAEPIFRRAPEIPEASLQFDQQVIGALANAGRADELFAAQEELARDWPFDASAQNAFAQALANRGELDRALAWIDGAGRRADRGRRTSSTASSRRASRWSGTATGSRSWSRPSRRACASRGRSRTPGCSTST